MSAADDFDETLANIRARILEVTASANPDYSVGGRSISRGAYLSQLKDSYKEILALRQQADNGGAWEVRGYGIS